MRFSDDGQHHFLANNHPMADRQSRGATLATPRTAMANHGFSQGPNYTWKNKEKKNKTETICTYKPCKFQHLMVSKIIETSFLR